MDPLPMDHHHSHSTHHLSGGHHNHELHNGLNGLGGHETNGGPHEPGGGQPHILELDGEREVN